MRTHSIPKQLSAGQILAGALIAAVYGFTAAVLLTPMSGKRTRERLKHFLDKRPDRLEQGTDLKVSGTVLLNSDELVMEAQPADYTDLTTGPK